tara:strand:- start:223 stop:417 length:195 start_codon:yes stop_codon:yes gene_type:complete
MDINELVDTIESTLINESIDFGEQPLTSCPSCDSDLTEDDNGYSKELYCIPCKLTWEIKGDCHV